MTWIPAVKKQKARLFTRCGRTGDGKRRTCTYVDKPHGYCKYNVMEEHDNRITQSKPQTPYSRRDMKLPEHPFSDTLPENHLSPYINNLAGSFP
jgi:hypothetical protein